MKINELVKRTGVHKETIRYYINKGLLPKPRKLGSNSADYGEEFVEGLRLIKELKEQYFLPLSVIKRIIKKNNSSKAGRMLLDIQSEFFRPLDQLLPTDVKGEEAFLQAVEISPERLAAFEEAGVISPEIRKGQKIYSQDDLKIGKVLGAMKRAGLSKEFGFRREIIIHYFESIKKTLEQSQEWFAEDTLDLLSEADYSRLSTFSNEILSVLFYHMVRKIACDLNGNSLKVRAKAKAARLRKEQDSED